MKSRALKLVRFRPEFTVFALYALKVFNRLKEKRIFGHNGGKSPGGGTGSGEYCYNLWLKHLASVQNVEPRFNPKVVAELGPGNSIGSGLAALISGCEKYYALDVVPYSNICKNLQILDEIVGLFRSEKNISANNLFLKQLDGALADQRLEEIKEAIVQINHKSSGICIYYFVPWNDAAVIRESSVDFIYSHSVLEHVSDIGDIYSAMYKWLRPGGFMSHRIDFGSHGKSIDWNGHWMYPEYIWKIVGKEYINRLPISRHLKELNRNGFEVIGKRLDLTEDGIQRKHLAKQWKNLSDEDLTCYGVSLQAKKPDHT